MAAPGVCARLAALQFLEYEVMDILEAGAQSAASGRVEPVDRASWSAA
jgi:hypothetical protein